MAIKDELGLAEPGTGGFFNSDAYAAIYEQALRNREARNAAVAEYRSFADPLLQQQSSLYTNEGYKSVFNELEPTLRQQFNQMVQGQPVYQEYMNDVAKEQNNIAQLQSARQKAIETGQPQSIKFTEPADPLSPFNLIIEPPGKELSSDEKRAYEAKGISVVGANWVDQYQTNRAPIIDYYKQTAPLLALTNLASDMGRWDLSGQVAGKSANEQIDFYNQVLFDDLARQRVGNEIETRSNALESQIQQSASQLNPLVDTFDSDFNSIVQQLGPARDRYSAEATSARLGIPVEDILRESDEFDAARIAEKQAADRLIASPEYQNLLAQGKYDEIYDRFGIREIPNLAQLQQIATQSPIDPNIFVPTQPDTTPILQPVVPPPQSATQTQSQAQPAQGVQAIQAAQTTPQISKETADRLAKELIVAGNIGNLTEGNQAVANPVDTLSRYIQANGIDKTVEDLRAQNVDFSKYYVPKTAPDVAKDLANKVSSALGFPPENNPAVASYQLALQNLGIEAGLKEIASINKKPYDQFLNDLKGKVSSGDASVLDYYNTRNTEALKGFYDTAGQTFNQNLQDILAGKDVRPTVAPQNVPAEEAVTQAFLFYGNQPAGATYEYWKDYFNKFGNDVGLAQLSAQMAGQRPGQGTPTIAEPREVSRDSAYNVPANVPAGFYGEDTSPFAGGYRPATTYPTFQQQIGAPTGVPTGAPTGAPSGPILLPTTTSRPFITEAERPTLDTAVQYIESTRPGEGPMPYMTAQQVGASPVQPASYADLFGYTPYTEYIGQSEYTTPMNANLYAAGYEANIPTTGLKAGGSVADARGLAAMGRGGDTMLVHMAPEEVAGLRALAMREGTDLTINPETGLPEAKKLKRLFKQVILPAAAAYFGAPYLGGVANASMLYGAATAVKTGNLEKGLMAGLAAYGGGSAAESMFGASSGIFGAPSTAAPVAPGAPAGPSVGTSSGAVESGRVSGGYGDFTGATAQQAATQTTVSNPPAAPPVQTGNVAAKPPTTTGMSPTTALIGGTMLAGLSEGDKERELYEEERRRQEEEDRRRKALGAESFARANQPIDPRMMYGAGGGLVALARGGMTYMEAGGTTGPTGEPRMVAGTGDGMSDSVPATIEGVQEARLANDEFVIPADVVADIGNGSSSAGAKKLYDMMARIREARHGTTEQPPEVNAEQFMPA